MITLQDSRKSSINNLTPKGSILLGFWRKKYDRFRKSKEIL